MNPTQSEALAALCASVGMDHGFFVGFSREQNGWSWVVISAMAAEIGDSVKGGLTDDWDSAKLASIEDLMPPSEEGEPPSR